MEELQVIMKEFGVTGLWAIVLYKLLSMVEQAGILLMIGYGVKKAWPSLLKLFEEEF